MTRRLVALGAVLAGLMVAQAAQAQTYPPPPPPGSAPPPPGGGYYAPPAAPQPTVHRNGFTIGFSLGGGAMSPDCDGCESLEGPAFAFHIGAMLTPRLALMGDFSGVGHAFEDDSTLVHSVLAFAAQYWVMDQLWIKGGIAAGRLSLSDANGDEFAANESGGGIMGAAGFEVLQSRNFTLDLQFRAASIHYSDGDFNLTNIGFHVGVNWF